MNRTEWINKLEDLHHRLRQGQEVGAEERAWYVGARDGLLATALDVQAIALTHENLRRRSMRVARAVPVLLEARGWTAHTLTADLGAGGFAVLLEQPPPVDDWIKATLLLPGEPPTVASVALVESRMTSGLVRAAFRFSEPSEQVVGPVENYIMDGILEHLVFWEDVLGRLGT